MIRSSLRTACLLIAIALVPATAIGQDLHPTAVVDAFHTALEGGDGEAALAQLAPDVVIFESGGAEMSRDEYASHHMGGDMRFASAVTREVTDRQHQIVGDLAYVLSRTRTTGTMGEREIDSTGVETMILRQYEGRWHVVHIHWSSRSARPRE